MGTSHLRTRPETTGIRRVGTDGMRKQSSIILRQTTGGPPCPLSAGSGSHTNSNRPGSAPPGAQALVDQPRQFLQEIARVLDDQKAHPILNKCCKLYKGTPKRKPPVVQVAGAGIRVRRITRSSSQQCGS